MCNAVDNRSNNTIEGSCHPTHQAVSSFLKDHLCVQLSSLEVPYYSGSMNFNKSFEWVTINDSKFVAVVLV